MSAPTDRDVVAELEKELADLPPTFVVANCVDVEMLRRARDEIMALRERVELLARLDDYTAVRTEAIAECIAAIRALKATP